MKNEALPKVSNGYALTLLMAVLASTGCWGQADLPEIGTVEGTFTLDDKPYSGVVVVFTPDEGRPSFGMTDAEGKYELKYKADVYGAKIGHHSVGLAPPQDETPSFPIPKKYFYGPESELEAVVEGGSNTLDFALSAN